MLRCAPHDGIRAVWFVATIAWVLASASHAQAAKKSGRPVGFAVFPPILQGRPDPEIASRLVESLEAEGRVGPQRVLSDRRLQRRLRKDPQELLESCSAQDLTPKALACVAKGATKAAPHAIIIVVAGIENEVTATFKVISTETQDVLRTLEVKIASATDATMAMESRSKIVLGFEASVPPPVSEEPLMPLATLDGSEPPGDIDSRAEPPPTTPNPEEPVDVMDGLALEAPPPTPEATLDLAPPPARNHTLTYIGAGVGGAGVLLFLTGMGYGIRSEKLESGINRDAQTQAQGLQRYRNAEDASKRANVFFALGSVVTAGGVGLILWNTIFRDPAREVVDVTAGPTPDGGAQGSVRLRW